jgi:3-oxoacyl-[acyl-carrier protein] reductase
MKTDLAKQTVLLTGATGGIGQAAARALAAEGANVVVHYHKNEAAARELHDELGERTFPLQADLCEEEQVERLFAASIERFGRLDCLVANAAIAPQRGPVHSISTERWRQTMRANLDSVFFCCRAFLQHLKNDPREAANIILIGSTAAIFGEANLADYATTKSAMAFGLTLSLKNEIVELAPRGRVNCICPGWTDTPMANEVSKDASIMNRVYATMPLRKIATPEDIAAAIVFFASDTLSGHISGAALPIAGGMEGRLLHRP